MAAYGLEATRRVGGTTAKQSWCQRQQLDLDVIYHRSLRSEQALQNTFTTTARSVAIDLQITLPERSRV